MKTKRSGSILAGAGFLLLAMGTVCSVLVRGSAIAEGARQSRELLYALSLIAALVGLVLCAAGLHRVRRGPEIRKTDVRTLAQASVFAALCYIGFALFKIDIPVGAEKTAFHLGNVFCVLAALFLGGLWGGMAGAVGMTIADLTSGYVTSAPKTFLLKLGIGLIVGPVAQKAFHLNQEKQGHKRMWGTVASAAAGMAFNVVADPVVGYLYKTYVLGVPQDAAATWAKIGAVTTLVNAIVAVAAASVFYLALRPALERAGLIKPAV